MTWEQEDIALIGKWVPHPPHCLWARANLFDQGRTNRTGRESWRGLLGQFLGSNDVTLISSPAWRKGLGPWNPVARTAVGGEVGVRQRPGATWASLLRAPPVPRDRRLKGWAAASLWSGGPWRGGQGSPRGHCPRAALRGPPPSAARARLSERQPDAPRPGPRHSPQTRARALPPRP